MCFPPAPEVVGSKIPAAGPKVESAGNDHPIKSSSRPVQKTFASFPPKSTMFSNKCTTSEMFSTRQNHLSFVVTNI